MGESADIWGELIEQDGELAEAWDKYERLPEPGVNDALDAFVASKRIDIPALVRVGARLSDYRVLVFGGPTWLKYRDMETGRRWTATGSQFDSFKIVPGRQRMGDTVIVAEGETDSARLTLLYPEADVAILPGGARRFTAAMAEQLNAYARVYASYDRDEAGDAGWAKLAEHVGHAQRFNAPGDVKDWCEYAGEPPALPDPPAVDTREVVGKIIFEPLDDLLAGSIPDPEVLVDDLLYTQGVHLVSGHPGCGKSTMALFMALQVMHEGGHVVWLDYEAGRLATARRLIAVGAEPGMIAEHFHYAGWPPKAEDHLPLVAERWPGALVVMDSLSKALAFAGIDENANSEVTRWTVKVVKACKDHCMPIVIIDHIAKGGITSEYSRGAGAKLADVDVHWRIIKDHDFNRVTAGAITVKQMKDREGFLPFATWWEVGDGNGKLTILPTDAPPDQGDKQAPSI